MRSCRTPTSSGGSKSAGYVTASDATAFILGTPSLTLLVTLHTAGGDAARDGARHRGRLSLASRRSPAWNTCRRDAFAISGSIGMRSRTATSSASSTPAATATASTGSIRSSMAAGRSRFEQAMARFTDLDRPAGAGHLGVGKLPRRAGRPAGDGRELVRSGGVCRVVRASRCRRSSTGAGSRISA